MVILHWVCFIVTLFTPLMLLLGLISPKLLASNGEEPQTRGEIFKTSVLGFIIFGLVTVFTPSTGAAQESYAPPPASPVISAEQTSDTAKALKPVEEKFLVSLKHLLKASGNEFLLSLPGKLSSEQTIAFGNAACQELFNGTSLGQLYQQLRSEHVNSSDDIQEVDARLQFSSILIAASIYNLCPSQKWQLEDYKD